VNLAAKTREQRAELTPEEKGEVIAAQRTLLSTICPLLVQPKLVCNVEGCNDPIAHGDYLHLTGGALSELLAFYMRQNWDKLREMLAIGENGERPKDAAASEKIFRNISREVAKAYGNSFDEFINLRFEESASRAIEFAEAMTKKAKDGETSLEDFFDNMAGEMGLTLVEGDAPVQVTPPVN
jgi:hypothetical protein